MTRTRKDYLDLLQETIDYYSVNPEKRRATSSDDFLCVYKTADNKRCAIGRLIKEEYINDAAKFKGDILDLSNSKHVDQHIDELFKEKYQGFDIDFYYRLQKLHDSSNYWNENGLTIEGKSYSDDIKGDVDDIISESF